MIPGGSLTGSISHWRWLPVWRIFIVSHSLMLDPPQGPCLTLIIAIDSYWTGTVATVDRSPMIDSPEGFGQSFSTDRAGDPIPVGSLGGCSLWHSHKYLPWGPEEQGDLLKATQLERRKDSGPDSGVCFKPGTLSSDPLPFLFCIVHFFWPRVSSCIRDANWVHVALFVFKVSVFAGWLLHIFSECGPRFPSLFLKGSNTSLE